MSDNFSSKDNKKDENIDKFVEDNDYESDSATVKKEEPEMATMLTGDDDDDDHNQDEKDEDEDNDNRIPIDRGWAWMVVLGCFMEYFIYGAFFFILSVLFLDIIEIFDTTATTVTLISSIINLVFCISTQLMVNLLMPIVSVRKMAIVCSMIWSFSTLVIVAVPNLPVFFTVCIIKYIAQGGTLVPSLTLVGHYFRRRQALATSLSLLGLSVASIVVPPMTRYLREEYGFKGSFLILSGVEMNAIVASSLLRPLTSYKKRQPNKKASTYFDRKQEFQDDNSRFRESYLNAKRDNAENPGRNFEYKEAFENVHNGKFKHDTNYEIHIRPISKEAEALSETELNPESRVESLHDDEDISIITRDNSNNTEENARKMQNQSLKASDRELTRSNSELKPQSIENANGFLLPQTRHSDLSNRTRKNLAVNPLERISRWSLASSSVNGSMVSIPGHIKRFSRYETKDERNEVTSIQSQNGSSTVPKTCMDIMKSVIDLELLKNLISWVYLLSFTFNYACVFVSAYLPSYAVKVGVSESNAAVLLTIIGVIDVFARIGYGYFADLRLVRPGRILVFTTLYVGIMCQFTALFTSFSSLIFVAVSFGVFGFASFSLNSPLIVDLLGIENLGKMLALGTVVTSVMSSLQFPLHGIMIEKTGTFLASFHYIGISFILGSFCLLIEPCVRRLQHARELRVTAKKLAS